MLEGNDVKTPCPNGEPLACIQKSQGKTHNIFKTMCRMGSLRTPGYGLRVESGVKKSLTFRFLTREESQASLKLQKAHPKEKTDLMWIL